MLDSLMTAPRPPGKHTFQNCKSQTVPETAGKKKTRYPAGPSTRVWPVPTQGGAGARADLRLVVVAGDDVADGAQGRGLGVRGRAHL